MLGRSWTIGHLSKSTGVKVTTIRYYESIGLMTEAKRTPGGQRVYDETEQARLTFIRQSRELGFTIEAIRDLISLKLTPGADCADVEKLATHHLSEVDKRLVQLRELRRDLKQMISSCNGGDVSCCTILNGIARQNR